MSDNNFVQVAVNLPLKDVFDYSVPDALQNSVAIGKRVWVPFGQRTVVGTIVGISVQTKIPRTRNVKEVIDQLPILTESMLKLTRWIADYYFCSWGEAIEAAIPAPFKKGKTQVRVRQDTDSLKFVDLDLKAKDNILNPHQDKALTEIFPFIKGEKFGVFLLHGITASGKTEVYFRAIEAVLKQNKQILVFVPEIALTPQTLQRFVEKFGKGKIAVIHSRLNKSEKFTQWERIKTGEIKIVIGPRSVIFSPVPNLGLIVVDEEHEQTYKQEDVPRYHLVDTAIKRAEISQAVVILGSATPSLESAYRAKQKEFKFIKLPERIKGIELPKVQIADMRLHMRTSKRKPIISKILEDHISNVLKKKEQVILFLNRRGFSTFIHCEKCGYVVQCPRCNVALVHHFDKNKLICHHCNYQGSAPEICPECNESYIRYFGTGTQKVESELYRLFPQAMIERMDSDSMQKKTAHFDIFKKFTNRKIDILIGTQMLAKGLDFPNVTLVGVISADVTLNLPDFRASERTFSLLTQVAGRTGRGKEKGKVIIQTYTPEHYAIQCAIEHNYERFYNEEIVFRKQLDLPPLAHMISIIFRSKDEKKLEKSTQALFNALQLKNKKNATEIFITEPAPLPVSKLRGEYRWGLVLKAKDVLKINFLLKEVFQNWRPASGVKIAVDVDPMMVV